MPTPYLLPQVFDYLQEEKIRRKSYEPKFALFLVNKLLPDLPSEYILPEGQMFYEISE